MKSSEEIERLSESYSNKIMEVAYYNFPLVHPKETVSKVKETDNDWVNNYVRSIKK